MPAEFLLRKHAIFFNKESSIIESKKAETLLKQQAKLEQILIFRPVILRHQTSQAHYTIKKCRGLSAVFQTDRSTEILSQTVCISYFLPPQVTIPFFLLAALKPSTQRLTLAGPRHIH